MTSVWGCRHPHHKRSSAACFIAPPDSSPPPELGDKLSDQPAGLLGAKTPVANAPATATSIPKYSEDDLQWILKTILEARFLTPTPVLTPAPAPIVAKASQMKLKARFLDVYHRKFHIDCYNFCQQYEDYFATTRAIRPTRILFAVSFF